MYINFSRNREVLKTFLGKNTVMFTERIILAIGQLKILKTKHNFFIFI